LSAALSVRTSISSEGMHVVLLSPSAYTFGGNGKSMSFSSSSKVTSFAGWSHSMVFATSVSSFKTSKEK